MDNPNPLPVHLELHALTQSWPLFDAAASRAIEGAAAVTLPAHTLMRRAGWAVARVALAIAPHAKTVWVAAGPGNNGGDGFEAAQHLHRAGKVVHLTAIGDAARRPADAQAASERACAAGVVVSDAPPAHADLVIDALLGLGATRAPTGALRDTIAAIDHLTAPCLAVDLPSGLGAETGQRLGDIAVTATHTLALLTLKPGLFTGVGRDHAGMLWFDALGCEAQIAAQAPRARLRAHSGLAAARPHGSHKGSYGDLIVVGGAAGMTGAAWLAARAALAAGAGRVFVAPLDGAATWDAGAPELMCRPALWRDDPQALTRSTVVCGCGGGDAVREALPCLLSRSARLLLDADALNAVASDAALQTLLQARGARGLATVLTPHPLEAARLLGHADAAAVQADRLAAAESLAQRFDAVVVLKGSGSVIAAAGRTPFINPTGNARLASPGTGDVLAGWLGGRWSARAGEASVDAFEIAAVAVWQHGFAARPDATPGPLRASALIEALARL